MTHPADTCRWCSLGGHTIRVRIPGVPRHIGQRAALFADLVIRAGIVERNPFALVFGAAALNAPTRPRWIDQIQSVEILR